METLLFHPKLVHIPMALGVLMPLLAAAVLVLWWRGLLPWRAWLLALGFQGILVASGVLAMQSGERDEERVERVVAESVIEAHEEAAELFVWGSGIVFAMMAAAAALGRTRLGLPVAAASTAATLVVLAFGYQTGQAGGSLVYEHGAASAFAGGGAGVGESAPRPTGDRHDDQDDD